MWATIERVGTINNGASIPSAAVTSGGHYISTYRSVFHQEVTHNVRNRGLRATSKEQACYLNGFFCPR